MCKNYMIWNSLAIFIFEEETILLFHAVAPSDCFVTLKSIFINYETKATHKVCGVGVLFVCIMAIFCKGAEYRPQV